MALPKNKPSGFVKSSLDSLRDENKKSGLHLEIDLEKLKPLTKPGLAGHQWVQQGPYLVCKSCPVEHAIYIGMTNRLVGFKNGRPVIKKIGKRSRKF